MQTETELPIDLKDRKLVLSLEDTSWPRSKEPYQDRLIARAVVLDGTDFIFAHIRRNDMFGKLEFLETSGGGVKPGESLLTGLKRELGEELGIKADVICELGQVTDYYNLIGRRNLNHYFLVRKIGEVPRHLEKDEIEDFHLEPRKVTYEEALKVYEGNKETKLGKLLYQREVPILELAKAVSDSYGLM
jgi:8-oxo-dGTP diphosphatase